MKKVLAVIFTAAVACGAFAQNIPDVQPGNNPHSMAVRGYAKPGGGSAQNLLYHAGGRTVTQAKVVCIFWGAAFKVAGSTEANYAGEIQAFRNQFGTTGEYNTITQYYGVDNAAGGGTVNIGQSNLGTGTADWFDDTSTLPRAVTDADVQAEVKRYIAGHGGANYSTIYEVFLPSTSYSQDGTQTSCGGPNLQYCAYHSHYSDGTNNVLYSIEPWPGCSGCSASGFTLTQNQEHFVCHETREAVTDALGNAWFDRTGYEADDKCAWSPAPFIDGGYGYQYEWSNANGGCVKIR
jgi:hypothetical protein